MATPSKLERYLTEFDKLELKHKRDEIILKRMREVEEKKANEEIKEDDIIAQKLGLDEESLKLFYQFWFKLGGKKVMFETIRSEKIKV